MSLHSDEKTDVSQEERVAMPGSDEKGGQHTTINARGSEVLTNNDLLNDAYDGEDREHQMGMWAAVKMYPWACFYAFAMCFTIVSW